ncbi:MAG: c-type cytochrome [Phycisphaerae bacterium]
MGFPIGRTGRSRAHGSIIMIRRRRAGCLPVVAGLVFLMAAGPALSQEEPLELGDVVRGWRVFHQKRCTYCHAVWGQGGQIGPDLGRSYGGHLSANQLAGGMWNHVPRMLALIRQHRLPEVTLTRSEMADIFSLLYFVRYLDEPGDPREGRRVLDQKRCADCHEEELEAGEEEIGPRLTQWSSYVNPIVWAQMMWEHSAGMEKAMKDANIEWPELDDDDLANIIAFIRSVGTSGNKVYLRPGSSVAGQRLFTERKCADCHTGGSHGAGKGPDLARIELPRSLSALASRMWNHLPAMRKVMSEQNVDANSLTAQDMADIIAYLFARQYEGEPGNVARGKEVFEQKRCADCHLLTAPETGAAEMSSPVAMGHAIWQHGAKMADDMAQAGIPWPTFEGTQMADLIAYIKSVGQVSLRPKALPNVKTGAQEGGESP